MRAKLILTIVLLSLGFAQYSFAQGCMETSGDDGVQVIGYVQPEFDYSFFGDDDQGNANRPSSFYFKRARLGVAGSIPYDVSYYVMAEFSPIFNDAKSPFLLDAFITYAPLKEYAKFSIGQFKAPFGLELNTPCHALHTIRRSTVVNMLASPFRDMGIMVLGSSDSLFGKKDLISYRLALLNGTGINTPDDNANKEFAGRLIISPWEWIKIGGSYRTGLIGAKKENEEQYKRTRFGFDLSLEYKNFLVQGEYISGEDIGEISSGGGCGKSTEADVPHFDKSGFFVQAMYMTPWNLQPVVKYETFDSDKATYAFLDNLQTYNQDSWTFGFNYFLNEWTRIQVNYMLNIEETASAEFDNDILMVQVQAKF